MAGPLLAISSPSWFWAIEGFEKTLTVGKFLCFLHLSSSYLSTSAMAIGPSMIPTIDLTGNFVLVERISTHLGKVGSGDLVLLRSPENPRKLVIKRIIGMEGDTVTYLVKPYENYESRTIVVPKGRVWVEGDNKYNSHDSRDFGAVPYGLVEGRLFWRIWPVSRFGSLLNK
ncbi:hypothetical protein SAY86_022192 [Trapa natans]|uniref:Peptidase S26 domain-containing protein n=1 Tax=Trapa natans TaxID=22666 RepID=A0AAN7M9A3_TRANT|nr:hypothetical protein SAY86_022192 [Trapa natans]